MQFLLEGGKRLNFDVLNENTLDFIFNMNGAGIQYFRPSSITVTITRRNGSVYYSGTLWDLFVFQNYYVGSQLSFNRVLRKLTSWQYTPSYLNQGNFDYLRVQIPADCSVDVVCEQSFGSYIKTIFLNVYATVNQFGAVVNKDIKKVCFVGNRLETPAFEFLLFAPQFPVDLTGVLGGYFNCGVSCVNDDFIGTLSEDFAFRSDLSFVGVNTVSNQVPYSIYRNMKKSVLERWFVTNTPLYTKVTFNVYYV